MEGANGRVALLIPWIGELPWYYGLFEASVRYSGVDLLLIRGTAEYFRQRAEKALGVSVGLTGGYKLCDLRPMYGRIFAEELKGREYFAYGDCDVVFGRRMGEWVRKVVEEGWDVACIREGWTSGSFTLLRNCDRVNSLFERAACWREVAASARHFAFDELGLNWFLEYAHGGKTLEQLRAEGRSFASVMWVARDVRFLHEDVYFEDSLERGAVTMRAGGELLAGDREIAAFHMVGVKTHLSFRGPRLAASEVGEYSLSRYGYLPGDPAGFRLLKAGRLLAGGAAFALGWLRGRTAERQRVLRVFRRVILRRPRWWE